MPLLWWPARALAGGGFEYPDLGAVAMGRGGAFAAKANNGTAIYYNPSGLAQQTGWQFLLDGYVVDQSIAYQRTDQAGNPVGPAVFNTGGVTIAPFVAISRQILPGLTVAVGAYGPPGNGKLSFPDETPPQLTSAQRATFVSQCGLSVPASGAGCPGQNVSSETSAPQKYQLISQNLLAVYPTVAVGWAPPHLGRWLQVGGSLQLMYGSSSIRQATFDGAAAEQNSQNPMGGTSKTWTHQPANELLMYDTIANLSVSGMTLTGIFGVTVTPLPSLRIGASYRPKHTLVQSGTLKLDLSPEAQGINAKVAGPGSSNAPDGALAAGSGPVTLGAVFPGEFKSGVDYDFGAGDIELDFNYTQWSQFQDAVLTPQFSQSTFTNAPAQLPSAAIPRNFRDTFALRLGGDFRIPVPVVRLTVRAGGGYESSAYDPSQPQYVTVGYANFAQIYGALGATVGLGWFDLDLAYNHVYMPEDDVRNSGVNAAVNGAPTPSAPVIVGNGNYKSSYDVLALGLRAHF